MPIFKVFVFLLHTYIPDSVRLDSVVIEPQEGSGIQDAAELIDRFSSQLLGQPPQPEDQRKAMSDAIAKDDASVVISLDGVNAPDFRAAIEQTKTTVLLLSPNPPVQTTKIR